MIERREKTAFRRLPAATQASYEIAMSVVAGLLTYFIGAYVLELPSPAPYVGVAVGAYLLVSSLLGLSKDLDDG